MPDADTDKLRAILAFIDDLFADDRTPEHIIAELCAEHGAKLNTSGATNTLRIGGVTGSCAASTTHGLLGLWRRNAEKRLDPDQRATIGHNSRRRAAGDADDTDARLRLLIERVERLEEEKKGIGDDIRDVYAEGKAVGYDARMMRKIVALRKMPPDQRREEEALLETYKCALGLV